VKEHVNAMQKRLSRKGMMMTKLHPFVSLNDMKSGGDNGKVIAFLEQALIDSHFKMIYFPFYITENIWIMLMQN